MASGAELKARLETFIAEQQKAVEKMDVTYKAERTRVQTQIAAAQGVLAKWDASVDGLVDALGVAGIVIRLE
jgi:hypothetical protein